MIKLFLDESTKKGVVKTAFIGDLEDACQNGEWEKGRIILS